MGNSNSRKARKKPRKSVSIDFKATPTPTPSSPKSDQCSERKELGMLVNTTLSRRAYRHHRKRLARIVADQWMYTARFRLMALKLRKHREQIIKRFCIAEWRSMVGHRLRMSQIVKRASVFCYFLMERRSFHKWKNYFYSKLILAEAFQRTTHMADAKEMNGVVAVRCKQQMMVLTTLQNHCQERIMERQQWLKAQRFQMLSVLKFCCSQWSSFVQERLSAVQMDTRAHRKWRNYQLRSVFSMWKNAMLLEKVHQVGSAATEAPVSQAQVIDIDQVCSAMPEDLVVQAQILTNCFWRWYLLVSQKKVKMENYGDKSSILAERHHERNLQHTAYDGWRKFTTQSSMARSISGKDLELENMINVRPQSEILHDRRTSRRVWGNEQNENAKALSELLRLKCCSTNSRREWTTGQNEYAIAKSELLRLKCCSTNSRREWTTGQNEYTIAKSELLNQMYCSTGSRRVWNTKENDYARAKGEILKLMYCSKPSSQEFAVSWFVKSLVKRFLCLWKEQVLIIKRHRQNHWYAVVHSKVQCLLKGFLALQENVDVEYSKQSLQELSMNCYNQNLKRKTVSGCKLLHQTKRVKLVQIEQAAAQWRTAKLQERFEKWYFATALRSMRRNLQQKSVNFRKRQLLLRAFQAWRYIKGLFREKGNLKMTGLTRLREQLSKFKIMRILSDWKSLRKEMNIKRFNEAQALQFCIGFRAASVVKALYVHMQGRTLKRSLLAKAAHFQNTRSCKLAISTWSEYVLLKNLSQRAANHRRYRLLKHAMTSLIQWQQPHVEFRDAQEGTRLQESTSIHRRLHSWGTPSSAQKPVSVLPARAQPRRPSFLYEDGTDPPSRTLQRHTTGEASPSSFGSLTPRDANLVAKEVEWMEQVLLDYEELKVHIVELRAELALLFEERTPGLRDGVHQQDHKIQMPREQKIAQLQEEIHSSEAKKTVQRPLIQAVLSRVQDLRIRKIPDA